MRTSWSRLRAAAVIAAVAVGLTACGSNGGGADAAGAGEKGGQTRAVRHEAGTTQVPVAPKRIVSVSVTMTGHLLALDAPVVASQGTPPSPFTDQNGFFKQWAGKAQEKGVKLAYQGFEADLEKILAQKPDLIIGAATGHDSTLKVYDKLKGIAPTVLFRHDNVSWPELTAKLGAAIGLEARAKEVVDGYNQRIEQVKSKIKVPEQEAVLLRDSNTEIPVFTANSAQGGVLGAVGFKVRTVEGSSTVKGEGAKRDDLAILSQETLAKSVGDASLFFVGHNPADIAKSQAKPVWKDLPAVKDKRVYDLGVDSFRMDYFSAMSMLDRVEKLFA
ncbi:Fe2+-enterobactin ABC transporter substrate-binding protein [Bailinhaonella thermotolerans]|uniref:Fe2+-enterobactin ABC transporter substrate-binding protein n=1 Tax=Bailinhaonella thermotolerans TaxID=1070861 RepID=A0A3A4AWD2_9ACTN|nr:Fe2+-enterobactin ABC transporter substrate-binding protein [Bailinhaonella thermotolerans]RJL34560.1 Fe2+-enterobactin ABC transporter substrate-binding protein [Bailinhaonella thermotolerans]